VGFVVAAVLCQAQLARAECGKDFDCEGEQICEDGQCVAPPASPPPPAAPSVSVPAPARARAPLPPLPVQRRLKRPGLLVLGIAATSVGTMVLVFGAPVCSEGACDSRTAEVLLLGCLGGIGVGVPLIVLGAEHENVPSVAIGPYVAPRQGGLRFELRL